jgi:hypothetical protein
MSRRAHERDPALHWTVEQRVDHRHGAARSELGDRDALGADIGVRVDVALFPAPADLAKPGDEPRIVHPRELFVGRGARGNGREHEAGFRACPLDRRPCSIEAFRSLGVIAARAVPEEPRVREEKRVRHGGRSGLPQSSCG